MTSWFAILAPLYVLALVFATLHARRGTHSSEDYVMAGSDVGVALGFLSFSATLFSTFTLMGMPDFFRVHGVGAWVFLGVTDAAMAFVLLWFGSRLRRYASENGFSGVAALISSRCGSQRMGFFYIAALFAFIVPYVSVQVRGISIFLFAIFPDLLPVWGWAGVIVAVLLVYSELGGLKAIMYSDALQGLLLLGVTWLIAVRCIGAYGDVGSLIERAGEISPALLSVPGPAGLFDTQFLLASFLAMTLLPVTQPQLTTRIVVMKDMHSMHRMAVAVGTFAILVILPTVVIGFYGAIVYPESSTADFLTGVLVRDQPGMLAATVVIGLLAAAMSTADSQLFALGTELRSLLSGSDAEVMLRTRIAIVALAVAALVLSVSSNDELVLLARVSFTGTALLAPLVMACVLSRRAIPRFLPVVTGMAMLGYLASLFGWLPGTVGALRFEVAALGGLALFACVASCGRGRNPGRVPPCSSGEEGAGGV